MVLILELWDLLKIAFLLVQTLNQVQGDGGIEVPEALEGWSLSLSKGRENVVLLSARTLRHNHTHLLRSCISGSVEDSFLLVQTLNQVQGDGGIEVPEALEGRVLRAGSTPEFFCYEFIDCFRI